MAILVITYIVHFYTVSFLTAIMVFTCRMNRNRVRIHGCPFL